MSAKGAKKQTKGETDAQLAEGLVESAAEQAPEWLKPWLKKLAPFAGALARFINFAGPYVEKAIEVGRKAYKVLEPYEPEYILPMIIGLLMILFGGYFMLLIACVEAYRISGWDTTKRCVIMLYEDYHVVKAASDKDDLVDDNNDGVADVQQISKQELATRKIKVFLKSCNPTKLSDALSGIYTGFLAVLATLKMQFARTLALGVAIGDVLSKPAIRFLHPIAEAITPADYHKWIDVVIRYMCKLFGVWVAMLLQRILSALHSAMRGAQMFTDAFAVYTARRGFHQLSVGYWDEAFAAVVAVFGIYLQIKTAFSLPWLLTLPLFPALFVEKLLSYTVSYQAM